MYIIVNRGEGSGGINARFARVGLDCGDEMTGDDSRIRNIEAEISDKCYSRVIRVVQRSTTCAILWK